MQRSVVGGPLWGAYSSSRHGNERVGHHESPLKPLAMSVDAVEESTTHRWTAILLPTMDRVTVLNGANGQRVAVLSVSNENEAIERDKEDKVDHDDEMNGGEKAGHNGGDPAKSENEDDDANHTADDDNEEAKVEIEDSDAVDDHAENGNKESGRQRRRKSRRVPVCRRRPRRSISSVTTSNVGLVWVGCSDGTLHVFDLTILVPHVRLWSSEETTLLRPTRHYRIASSQTSIAHLSLCHSPHHQQQPDGTLAPNSVDDDNDRVLLYAVLTQETATSQTRTKGSKKHGTVVSLVRLFLACPAVIAKPDQSIPPADAPLLLREQDSISVPIVVLDQYECDQRAATSSVPFFLDAIRSTETAAPHGGGAVVVVVASTTKVSLYYDNAHSNGDSNHPTLKIVLDQSIGLSVEQRLTSCAVHHDTGDLACGYASGVIRMVHSVIPAVAKHGIVGQPRTPVGGKSNPSSQPLEERNPTAITRKLLVRKVHWHAHAVGSLTYDTGGTGFLYSGGQESVLLTWLAQKQQQYTSSASDKPIHKLPRIALGAIQHVLYIPANHPSSLTSTTPDTVLVACTDNSLQLLDAQSKSLVWKYQGLAAGTCHIASEGMDNVERPPCMTILNNNVIALSGLTHAPGCIQWFQLDTQRVAQQWDVVPFNRVSHTERFGDTKQHPPAMPTPVLTHAVFAQNHAVAVTIDVVPTEITSIGAMVRLSGDNDAAVCGSTTTIRFWRQQSTKAAKETMSSTLLPSYECVAAMTFPHGSRHRVAALAMNADGSVAATASNEESAIRLWWRRRRRDDVSTNEMDDKDTSKSKRRRLAPSELTTPADSEMDEWTCRCKIGIPSGYANFPVSALSFSLDSSVFAVAHGAFVTMWDLESVALLTALRHEDDSPLQSMSFLAPSDRLSDGLMLLHSATCVSLRSPHGNRGPNVGWNWKLPNDEIKKQTGRITAVAFLPVHEIVAIAQYYQHNDQSRVVVIDALTGLPFRKLRGHSSPIFDHVSGAIVTLVATNQQWRSRAELDGVDFDNVVLTMYALTNMGEMVRFTNRTREKEAGKLEAGYSEKPAPSPRFEVLENDYDHKRKIQVLEVDDLERAPTGALSLEHFGGISSDDGSMASSQLPLLRGAFVRAFIGRNLLRRDMEQ
jgi:hypothetical protein